MATTRPRDTGEALDMLRERVGRQFTLRPGGCSFVAVLNVDGLPESAHCAPTRMAASKWLVEQAGGTKRFLDKRGHVREPYEGSRVFEVG